LVVNITNTPLGKPWRGHYNGRRMSNPTIDTAAVIRANLGWFQKSGIMRPADGFWGVGERIVLMPDHKAGMLQEKFSSATRLAPGVRVIENRRPDCNVQAALLFDLAAEALDDPALKPVADGILDYLLNRSCLADRNPESPTFGLWGWANPDHRAEYWMDDNAWVAMALLMLARRGRPELRAPGLAAARALCRHARFLMRHVSEHGKDAPLPAVPVLGLQLNPHWMGLVTMALAHAAADDPETDYAGVVQQYYAHCLAGPSAWDSHSVAAARRLPWALSEYTYLSLTASVAGHHFRMTPVLDIARHACELLVREQAPDGHFRAEHYEAPEGTHLADLIYTQNWATLGLYHGARALDAPGLMQACQRSLEFLARIQDASPEPWLQGCWRGLYDTQAGTWGGGDRIEGGQGSLYSGWTNAPIALAFLMERLQLSFLVPDPAQ
jgi:hypothetical protein